MVSAIRLKTERAQRFASLATWANEV